MTAQEFIDTVLIKLKAFEEMEQLPRRTGYDPLSAQLKNTNNIGCLFDLHATLFSAYYLASTQKTTIKNYDVLCYCLQIIEEFYNNDAFRLYLVNEIIAVTNRDALRTTALWIKKYLEKKLEEGNFFGLRPEANKFFSDPESFNAFWAVSQVRKSSRNLRICKLEKDNVEIIISTSCDTSEGMFEYIDDSTQDSSIKLTFLGIKKLVVTEFNVEDNDAYGLMHDYRIVNKDNHLLFEVSDNWQNGERRVDFCIEAECATCSELKISGLQ